MRGIPVGFVLRGQPDLPNDRGPGLLMHCGRPSLPVMCVGCVFSLWSRVDQQIFFLHRAYVENWLPVSYVPYYLPCPEIFNMKLHCKREKPLQPVAWSQYPQPKLLEHRPTQLLTLTPWLAPIVSEGTFNPELLQHIYQPLNLTIGVTAFAVGKYTHFIQSFLESAEEFFMRGYRVHYYIFTDNPAAVPGVPLGPHRLLSTIPIQGHSSWEETSMRRMETISQHIAKRAHREVDYLFCLDVDMVFQNPWGPETLGDLVATVHPSYYTIPRQQFPYERRRVSTAFVADSEGEFYYGGKVFGGQVARVYEFTRGCHMAILADKANGIMAAWREESHLNRRFISNKPSKVLSPEYLWDDRKPQPPSLKLIRFSTLDKDISS
ncbi:globoside alpha-1,3-N-acetylgalactosaminyltransferase 1 isoform X1 [Macaca nemestrina]|uniref:globoside alpha-1,3-N-acetylgalactosaminyltransferase 1 isoform X1 n=2 Tax=Macaca nemestrina TaxID=9545 RepID=UPI0039B87DD9